MSVFNTASPFTTLFQEWYWECVLLSKLTLDVTQNIAQRIFIGE